MDLSEGEIKRIMEDDWFWKIFVMKDKLVDMIKKEHMIKFAKYLADKMESEPDNKEVPHNYIENELKYWLNFNFNITPPLNTKNNRF